tara:strand:+ start:5399 stop:6520 length:1122 start_codon:yes stop_codon:yes gene_type:complete
MASILQNISNMPSIYDEFNSKWWGDEAMIDEVNIYNENIQMALEDIKIDDDWCVVKSKKRNLKTTTKLNKNIQNDKKTTKLNDNKNKRNRNDKKRKNESKSKKSYDTKFENKKDYKSEYKNKYKTRNELKLQQKSKKKLQQEVKQKAKQLDKSKQNVLDIEEAVCLRKQKMELLQMAILEKEQKQEKEQIEMKQREMKQREMKQIEIEQREMKQREMKQREIEQIEMKQREIEQREIEKKEIEKKEIEKKEIEKREIEKREIDKIEIDQRQQEINIEKDINIIDKRKQSTKKYITLFGTVTNVVKGGCGFIKCDDPLETGAYVFTETKKIHKGDKVKFRTMNITKDNKQHFQKATNVKLVREKIEKQVAELLS